MSSNSDQCYCRRWAFSLQKALADDKFELNYRRAIQCVTKEDYDKIDRFRHKDDSLACLAGRLFLRQAARQFTGAEWHELEFKRTDRGKPYLTTPDGTTFGLNVTHQGDYTGFASSCTDKVGVDVMRLDMCRGSKTADDYIKSMKKSASEEEYKKMTTQATDDMKMTMFYRYWCLKEAVMKATGEGLLNDLSRYDFRIDESERYKRGCFLTSTRVLLDGKPEKQWIFEESFVDDKHAIAVCREAKLPKSCTFAQDPDAKMFFTQKTFDFLLEGATVLNPIENDSEHYANFMAKPKKAF
ncbi:t04g9.4 [Aphelenchoides avenae]|nr:t04g9.4 [Aphelenchus avenae]